MSTPANLIVLSAALACSACAAGGRSGVESGAMSALVDADRPCISGRWHRSDNGTTLSVSADNGCGRPLTCDVHLGLTTAAGPELFLDCKDRAVPIGHTQALCRWTAPAVALGGSGSMHCR